MEQVEVFVKLASPEHLAVSNEHRYVDEETGQYRSVCGAATIGMEVKTLNTDGLKLVCEDCQWQLDKWQEIHSSHAGID